MLLFPFLLTQGNAVISPMFISYTFFFIQCQNQFIFTVLPSVKKQNNLDFGAQSQVEGSY